MLRIGKFRRNEYCNAGSELILLGSILYNRIHMGRGVYQMRCRLCLLHFCLSSLLTTTTVIFLVSVSYSHTTDAFDITKKTFNDTPDFVIFLPGKVTMCQVFEKSMFLFMVKLPSF